MKSRYDYMYGSAAPQLPRQPQREEQQVRRTPPVRKKTVEPEPRSIPIVKIAFCILIGFGILFTMIFRFGMITEMNGDLAALNEEYGELKDDNRKLQADIGMRINQENIRQIAEERLNMKMPDSYQRISVNVPKVNYSTVAQEVGEEEKRTFLSLLTTLLQ